MDVIPAKENGPAREREPRRTFGERSIREGDAIDLSEFVSRAECQAGPVKVIVDTGIEQIGTAANEPALEL